MTWYAYYDSTQPAPSPVLGWFDTAAISYPNLPAAADLLALTATQWSARTTGEWAVSNGALVAYTPPAPTLTLAQQAAAAFGAGLAITSTGTPALNGTYAIDTATQAKITAVSVYILKNNAFPGGASTMQWPDITGALHTVPSTAEFEAFATEVANYAAALDLVIATDSGTLPPATATIA